MSAVTVVAIGLATAACAGVEPATSTGANGTSAGTAAAAVAPVPPEESAAVLADDVLIINVHVPDEGSIAGTYIALPYDEVRDRSAELSRDRDAPLAVYCRSGRMSAEAVATLRDLGYTDVLELRGGMDAWAADGRELLPPAG